MERLMTLIYSGEQVPDIITLIPGMHLGSVVLLVVVLLIIYVGAMVTLYRSRKKDRYQGFVLWLCAVFYLVDSAAAGLLGYTTLMKSMRVFSFYPLFFASSLSTSALAHAGAKRCGKEPVPDANHGFTDFEKRLIDKVVLSVSAA